MRDDPSHQSSQLLFGFAVLAFAALAVMLVVGQPVLARQLLLQDGGVVKSFTVSGCAAAQSLKDQGCTYYNFSRHLPKYYS